MTGPKRCPANCFPATHLHALNSLLYYFPSAPPPFPSLRRSTIFVPWKQIKTPGSADEPATDSMRQTRCSPPSLQHSHTSAHARQTWGQPQVAEGFDPSAINFAPFLLSVCQSSTVIFPPSPTAFHLQRLELEKHGPLDPRPGDEAKQAEDFF